MKVSMMIAFVFGVLQLASYILVPYWLVKQARRVKEEFACPLSDDVFPSQGKVTEEELKRVWGEQGEPWDRI